MEFGSRESERQVVEDLLVTSASTEAGAACLAVLLRLLDLESSGWQVVLTVTAISRSSRKPFQSLPQGRGSSYVQLQFPVSELVASGIPDYSNRYWLNWYLGVLRQRVDPNDIAFSIEPSQIWYPDREPHRILYRKPMFVSSNMVSPHLGRLLRSDHQRILLIYRIFTSDPAAWGLPDGYLLKASRADFYGIANQLVPEQEFYLSLWDRFKPGNALSSAIILLYAMRRGCSRSRTGQHKSAALKLGDTSWFDLPLDSIVDGWFQRPRSEEGWAASAAFVSLIMTLLMDCKFVYAPARNAAFFCMTDDLKIRSETARRRRGRVGESDSAYIKRIKRSVTEKLEQARDSALLSFDGYSNIILERAGAMPRPYVRIACCSLRWLLLIHYGLHFLPESGDVQLHWTAHLLPVEGDRGVRVAAYFEQDPESADRLLCRLAVEKLIVSSVRESDEKGKDLIGAFCETSSRFFSRTADPYQDAAAAQQSFLSSWILTPEGTESFEVVTDQFWPKLVRLGSVLVMRLVSYFEKKGLKLNLPDHTGQTDRLKSYRIGSAPVVGTALSIAGFASSQRGVPRRFGRAWILETERQLWNVARRNMFHIADLLVFRWFKSLLKFGASSAYGSAFIRSYPQSASLMALRELLALRYGLPVRPVASLADVDISYVYRSALPQIRRIDHQVPRDRWGVSLVPRLSLALELFFVNPQYYTELAVQAIQPIVGDPVALVRLQDLVSSWSDPNSSDASLWSGERIPSRLSPTPSAISALPGGSQLPEELTRALASIMAFPTIYTRKQRSSC